MHDRKLHSIEMLRGIAACIVVLSHVARHVDRQAGTPELISLFQPGHSGVDLFFTLSGFIILFVHAPDIGRPQRLRRYAGRRFSRVVPLYWIALIATIAMSVAGRHAVPSAGDMLWWAALLPTQGEPLFGIAWTLQYEALFYVCFGLLIVDRRLGLAAIGVWGLAIVACLGDAAPPPLCEAFGLEFLFGLVAAQIVRSVPIRRPALIAGLGGAAFAAAYALEAAGMMDGYGVLARFAYGVPAALTIVGLAAADRTGRVLLPRWLEPFGRASYSTYLFQFIVIGGLWQALLRLDLVGRLGPVAVFALLSAAALGGGLLVNRWIERPLLQAIRRPSPPPVAPASAAAR